MKRIYAAYRELLGILFSESPLVVIVVLAAAVVYGALTPFSTWVSANVFNGAVSVAQGAAFSTLTPFLILFVVTALLPNLLVLLQWYYAEPRSQLILRTAYKGKMIEKLKKLRYEHLENEQSMEIIDKAYNRTENAARHLFPMYLFFSLSSVAATIGTLYLFASVKWWLLLTILIPFAVEAYMRQRFNYNIYTEMEKYWKREREYEKLGNMLRSRDFVKENRIFQTSGFLIDTYRKRLNLRNREYEKYYFKHLKQQFTGISLFQLAGLGNAIILLFLFQQGAMSIGLLISLTLLVFTRLSDNLYGCVHLFLWAGFHINTYDFYDKYFALSEDEYGADDALPGSYDIEFDNVYFKYPGTEKEILKGLSFTAKNGEKLSIVGQNGEGKTTMVKLLLGLFQPDSGEIRIGGKPLSAYSQAARSKMFGAVFQDFVKYSITLGENIGVGNVEKLDNQEAIDAAIKKGKADTFVNGLDKGKETLLGRDFEGGVDLSGGQWQRIAIARAFMGDKPILILDEPTSQLDPMAESEIYSDFAEMSAGKTAVFITHRLGSTLITDRIIVITGGKVAQSGTHEELMASGGLYADMFNAQKQWYVKNREEGAANAQE